MAKALNRTGAEDVRWDLSDLFASPTDPKLEAALARSLERAIAFEAKYKGRLATLEPSEFAGMMSELEDDEDAAAKPDVYAYLLHSQNTHEPAAGRLLARTREASAERGSHGVFFTLELAQTSDEQGRPPLCKSRFRQIPARCRRGAQVQAPPAVRAGGANPHRLQPLSSTRPGRGCSRSSAPASASTWTAGGWLSPRR